MIVTASAAFAGLARDAVITVPSPVGPLRIDFAKIGR
jgi:hypothetical protein